MTKAPEVNPAPNPFDPAALRSDHRQDFVRVHSPSAFSIIDTATEAAARLNLIRGRDNKWHFDAGNPVASDNKEVRHER